MLSTRCGFSLQMLAMSLVSYMVSECGSGLSPRMASSASAGARAVKRAESAMSRAMAARSLRWRAWRLRLLRSKLNARR